MICTNCHQECDEDASLCPHCGATHYPRGKEETCFQSPSGDVVIGAAVGLMLLFLAGLGSVANPILWLLFKRSRPYFARGIGYIALVPVVLLLGALLLCAVPMLFYSAAHLGK